MEENGNGKKIHYDRVSGKLTINLKTLVYLVTMAGVIIGASWTMTLFCDRNEVRANTIEQDKFQKRFDNYYPTKHAPCSTRVVKLAKKVKRFSNDVMEIKAMQRAMANEEQLNVGRSYFKQDSMRHASENDEDDAN